MRVRIKGQVKEHVRVMTEEPWLFLLYAETALDEIDFVPTVGYYIFVGHN